jgi:hypothetical protein
MSTPLQSSPVGTPAIDFDGSSSLRSEPTSLGETPNITLSAWVYVRNPVGAGFRVVAKGYHAATLATPFYSVGLGENSSGFYSSLAIGGLHKGRWTDPLPRNDWSHVAVTYDGFQQRTYVNGKLHDTSPSYAAPIDWGEHGRWAVGSNQTNGERLDGLVADVRIDPVVRDEAFFSREYSRGIGGGCFRDLFCEQHQDCCLDHVPSPFDGFCGDHSPTKARVQFRLDPWGREGEFYVTIPSPNGTTCAGDARP